jgi:hypothetical protein
LLSIHDHDRVIPIKSVEDMCDGGSQIAARGELLLYKVGDHVAIGFRFQQVPACLEHCPELCMILDDSIMDDGNSAEAVDMGMGVCCHDTSMSRPTRVTETLCRRGVGTPVSIDAANVLVNEKLVRRR